MAPVPIGITPWQYDSGAPARLLTAQAERAEALGFESFWLPESHFTGPGANPAPLLWLAAVAARTQRIKVATTSFLLPVRNPLQVAEEVAVLDCLSEGRLILGVGRGFRRALFEAFDVPVEEKRDRFEAALEVMRDAWAGKPVTQNKGDGAILSPRPVQDPHPPIWVAAFGPKALALVGRLRLPYLASPMEPLAKLVQNYAAHREAVDAAGGETDPSVPVMRTVFAHKNASVRARVGEALERQLTMMARSAPGSLRDAAPLALDDWALVGEPAKVEDQIGHVRDALGMTHLIARTQIPGASEAEHLAALDGLAELSAQA